MSKYIGQSSKKKDRRVKKHQDGLQAIVSGIAGQTQKFINDWQEKHNKLAQMVDHIFKLSATEIGKVWGNEQQMSESIDHIDLNVLVLSELTRNLYKRAASAEQMLKKFAELAGLDEHQLAELEADGQELYAAEMKEAFGVVGERRKKYLEEKKAAEERAKKEADEAEQARQEALKAEQALRESESEDLSVAGSGGRGARVPEGAEVFGGG